MKTSNIYATEDKKILRELENYLNNLNLENEELRETIRTYNKEEEIQNLQNTINELHRNALHIMSEQERKSAKTFSEKHYHSCKSNIEYILLGTGIGMSISVKCCECKIEENITDISHW